MRFKHRSNRDGSFDSICLRCFYTVDTADNEASLSPLETTHDCLETTIRNYIKYIVHATDY